MGLINSFYSEKNECGTDEAGRGCLAGPVTAAAVILKPQFNNSLLNDSKQLSESKRLILKPIIESEAIAYGVAHVFEDDLKRGGSVDIELILASAVIELDVLDQQVR